MAEMKDIVKVAVDAYHGNVEQYSVGQSMELLHKALIDANGGSTTLNYKNIRDCARSASGITPEEPGIVSGRSVSFSSSAPRVRR